MTVWVKVNHKSNAEVYHTSEDCRHLEQSQGEREYSVDEAEDRGLRECKECSGDIDAYTDRRCPLCREPGKGDAAHIRNCDGVPGV